MVQGAVGLLFTCLSSLLASRLTGMCPPGAGRGAETHPAVQCIPSLCLRCVCSFSVGQSKRDGQAQSQRRYNLALVSGTPKTHGEWCGYVEGEELGPLIQCTTGGKGKTESILNSLAILPFSHQVPAEKRKRGEGLWALSLVLDVKLLPEYSVKRLATFI